MSFLFPGNFSYTIEGVYACKNNHISSPKIFKDQTSEALTCHKDF